MKWLGGVRPATDLQILRDVKDTLKRSGILHIYI